MAESGSVRKDSHNVEISRDDGGGQAEKIEGIKSELEDANAKKRASRSGILSILEGGSTSKRPESTMENNSGNEGSYTIELPEQHREAIARMKKKLPRIDEGSGSEPADRGKRSIFKIPAEFQEKEYVPQVVCIGPYYRGGHDLGTIEQIKRRCLAHLIHKSEKNLEVYWKKVRQLEQEAEDYYSETTGLSSVEFVEMMILDGCFILEFFLFHSRGYERIDEIHPIARIKEEKLPVILSDLLLSGNQIPFPVLTVLFEIFSDLSPGGTRLPNLMGEVFLYKMGIEVSSSDLSSVVEYENDRGYRSPEPLHLLDMARICLLPPRLLQRKVSQGQSPVGGIIHRISKLRLAGIKVNLQDQGHFWEVGFEAGVIKMPKIVLNDLMCSFLVNCVEFEYNYGRTGISSFVLFLCCLVNTREDVEFLRQNGVLEHDKENDDVAADFINSLAKNIAFAVKDSDFSSLCWQIYDYYASTLYRQQVWYYRLWQSYHRLWGGFKKSFKEEYHRLWGGLKKEYLDKPWLWISVFAGLVLLILTFLQTYYAMRSYLHPKN